MPIAAVPDPTGTIQVASPGLTGSDRVSLGTYAEHYARSLAPVSVIRFGIQEAQINDQVLPVVVGQLGPGRRAGGGRGV